MSLPRIPCLNNAISGYHKEFGNTARIDYVTWMRNQGVIMPMPDQNSIEFTDPKFETMFMLRWS